MVVKDLDDKNCFLGNESNCLKSKALEHPFDFESENYVDITSLPVDGTKIDSIEHMSHSIPKFHSPIDNDLGLVSDKVDFPIKSSGHEIHENPFLHLADINVKDVSLGLIGAPSSNHSHPLYPNLFHVYITPIFSTNHSHLYPTCVGFNHVHWGNDSQSQYEDLGSLVLDLFHPQSLVGEEEFPTSRPIQNGSPSDSS